MGVITGKGLSDLIREEFGLRSTFFVMTTGFLVDLGNVVAEFAGVAAAAQLFGVNKLIAVPLAAIAVWILVLKGSFSPGRSRIPRRVRFLSHVSVFRDSFQARLDSCHPHDLYS